MTGPTMIRIVDFTKPKPLWAALRGPSLQVGVVWIGVAVGSDAMQWMGFAALMVIAFARIAYEVQRESGGLTIAEARAKLDEIEGAAK